MNSRRSLRKRAEHGGGDGPRGVCFPRRRPRTRLGGAEAHLQVLGAELGAQEREGGCHVAVRADEVDVVDVGADDDPRELLVHFLESRLQAEREEERAQGVALLLAGDRLQRARLLLATDVQSGRQLVKLRGEWQQLRK